MADQFNVLVICGSLRKGSYNAALTRALPSLAPPGMKFVTAPAFETLPLYNADMQEASGFPGPAQDLAAAVRAADGVLFVTPEYNWSMPGGLKNAIDWASRPRLEAALLNKTVSVVGASPGQFGAMWAQADLRKILGTAGARVVGDELPVTRAHEKFDSSGRLLDGELFERLRLVLDTLAAESIPVHIAA